MDTFFASVEHPLVRMHQATGRPAPFLSLLCATCHRALADHFPQHRVMGRCVTQAQ